MKYNMTLAKNWPLNWSKQFFLCKTQKRATSRLLSFKRPCGTFKINIYLGSNGEARQTRSGTKCIPAQPKGFPHTNWVHIACFLWFILLLVRESETDCITWHRLIKKHCFFNLKDRELFIYLWLHKSLTSNISLKGCLKTDALGTQRAKSIIQSSKYTFACVIVPFF